VSEAQEVRAPIERPLRLRDEEVRAVLAGRQTELRHPLDEQPEEGFTYLGQRDGGYMVKPSVRAKLLPGTCHYFERNQGSELGLWPMICPFGATGDRLWVRETWNMRGFCFGKPAEFARFASKDAFYYRATDQGDWRPEWGGWRPATQMPREAARIVLEVLSIQVQRLQEIDEDGAQRQGVSVGQQAVPPGEEGRRLPCTTCGRQRAAHIGKMLVCPQSHGTVFRPQSLRGGFARAWDARHGSGAWASNPWVWSVGFRVVEGAPS
jgi:hypothetical protein